MAGLVTLTLSDDDCLNMRLALNMTACEWGDKAMEHRQRGEPVDADTCERLRAKYHALWERVHAAQQWEASIERGRPRLDFVNNRGE